MRFAATSQAVSRPSTEPAVRAVCSAQCADPSERDRAAVDKVQEKQNICLQSITRGYVGCSRHVIARLSTALHREVLASL